jgi:hypothetical protein
MPDPGQGSRAVTVPVVTAGNTVVILSSSHRLMGWSVGDAGNPPTEEQLNAAVAAAAAGSLTLTGFLTLSEVIVEPAAAWPAGVNQVTVTNIAGGTVTVDIEGGTANPVVISFPVAVPATGTPVVGVPAIVGGPAFTVTAAGTIAGAAPQSGNAVGNFLDGGQILGVTAPLAGVSDTQATTDDGIYVSGALTLKAITGALSGCVWVRDVASST